MSIVKSIAERMEHANLLGIGIGAAVIAPVLFPQVRRALRPAAKAAIKGYYDLMDLTRENFAETSEQWQDLVAEARSERDQTVNGAAVAMSTTAAEPKPSRPRASRTQTRKPAARAPRARKAKESEKPAAEAKSEES